MSSQNIKPFVVVNFPADNSGCYFYRMLAPKLAIQTNSRHVNFTETARFMADQAWFREVNLVHLQRQVSNPQHEYFTKFLVPLSKQTGMWVVYNIDDAIHMDDIPRYNQAWGAYQSKELMRNIREMMQSTDFLLVTTDYLKDYYIRKFGVNPDSIVVIPNYLPKWWMGQYYNLEHSMKMYHKYKKRPRIGVIASSTHYDVKNNNNGVDDFTHIIPFIKSTMRKYEWVFVGCVPQGLQEEAQQKKISFVQGSTILNYPDVIGNLNCQAIVQPLINNEFNRCKSNIKYLEAAAIGTPLIAQRLNIYEPYTDLLFDDTDELQKLLDKVLSDPDRFKSIVKKQYDELDHGRDGKGWWLENNLEDWAVFYKITKKTIDIDINRLIEHEERVREQQRSRLAEEEIEIIR